MNAIGSLLDENSSLRVRVASYQKAVAEAAERIAWTEDRVAEVEKERDIAAATEREACAKVAEAYAAQKKAAALKQTDATAAAELYAEAHAAENIADAIRARGEGRT